MRQAKRIAVIAAQSAMLAQAVFWIASAVMYMIKDFDGMEAVMVALTLVNGVAFAVLAFLHKKRRSLVKIVTLTFLAVNLVLTITDQMGTYDWLVLAANLITIGSITVSYLPEHCEASKDK